jgi:hypothetical protein
MPDGGRRRTAHDALRRLALILPLLFLATPVPAAAPTATDLAVPDLVLPSETCRGLFIVPVTFGKGGGTTLELLLDTGSTWTFIDPGAIRTMLGRVVRAGRVSFQNGRIGEYGIGPLRAYIYPMKTLSRAVGRDIDGILGFPVFKDVLLTLDYPAEEIRISSGRLPRPDGREIFRDVGFKRPRLKVDVGGRRVKVLLDSGSTAHFKLKPTDRIKWSVEPRLVGASVLFAGVTLKEAGRSGDPVQFGPLIFEAPVVSLTGDERLVGWHVLRHFVLTFDQKKDRIRMLPDDTAPVRMGPLVGPGVATRPRPEGLEIIRVFPGTSAEAAGLREGDLVIAVNGTPVHERGCGDPRGVPAGQRQVWSFLRDGIRAEVEIETETLVP